MTTTCPQCGAAIRPQARFCARCGRRLAPALVRSDGRLAAGAALQGGAYTIVRSISKGGMGAVYLARDGRAFDRLCVVKQMLDYFDASDPDERRRARARFEDEGRILAALSHPGIPRIYAFAEEEGCYYIVMEYIQGDNLESFLTRVADKGALKPVRRLALEEALRYGLRAVQILEYLHGQPRPVIHQDIKPANLILEGQLGDVRLVDFGTARVRIPQGDAPGSGEKASIYGTDGYAPPEQYRGQVVPRSDVFALGATLYHLLTDDDPRDHPFKWPRLTTLPRELAALLERALRVEPEARPTARELRQALESFVTPKRTLEVFTFPGNTQMRSVAALPALCDEHWGAARTFLYKGDFQRWLRDINRHDLVLAADAIVQREQNRDRGLEEFLHVVDAGLPQPKLVVDTPLVNLGSVARESALIRRVTVSNSGRGYAPATVSVSEPWLEVFPTELHIWAGIPADVRLHVHAEGLPLRREQRGVVTITPDGQAPVEVMVAARVSLARELWRLTWRALSAALPESWRAVRHVWTHDVRLTRALVAPFAGRPWLFWLLWFVLGLAVGLAVGLPWEWASALPLVGRFLGGALGWEQAVALGLMGPLLAALGSWLGYIVLGLAGGALWGALRGAWRSLAR